MGPSRRRGRRVGWVRRVGRVGREPTRAGVPTEQLSHREVQSGISSPAESLEAIGAGEHPGVAEIAELLEKAEGDEGPAISGAADAVARAFFAGRVTAMVGVRIAGHKPHRAVHKPDGGTGDTAPGVLLELRGIEAVAEEMSRQGFVYILLDMGELERLPRPPQELKRAMGERTIAVASAASLVEEAGAMVRDRMLRQFLLQTGDIVDLDARELAEVIVFLRNNWTAPLASDNLVSLLCPDPLAWRDAGLRRARAVRPARRIVFPVKNNLTPRRIAAHHAADTGVL